MRFALLALCAALCALPCHAQTLPGECLASYHTGGHYDAQLAWHAAMLEQRQLQTVDYPILVRRLRTDIKISEERIRMLQNRLRQYRPFNGFRQGGALTITVQETRAALMVEEQVLRELRLRLSEEQRLYRYQQQLLVLEAQRAANALAHYTAGSPTGTIEIVTHERVLPGESVRKEAVQEQAVQEEAAPPAE